MECLQKIILVAAVLVLLSGHLRAYPGVFLDDTDVCILICDKCYKNEALLKCANHCLATSGKMDHVWADQCPLFTVGAAEIQQM